MTDRRGGGANTLRIIGGEWRGRKLRFQANPQLRPTPDRVRETLFNWLTAHVHGARCLDLFAGSGALGLEALSRGAQYCSFVELDRRAASSIRTHLETLGCSNAGVHNESAQSFLSAARDTGEGFDLVFLDPPFSEDLLPGICAALEQGEWLNPETLIYLESPRRSPPPSTPEAWRQTREKEAGEVRYQLFVREPRIV